MPVAIPPPSIESVDSFYFSPAEAQGGIGALERRYGSIVAGWDTDPHKMLPPGMKVVFFGQPAPGCATDRRDGAAGAGPSWSPDPGSAGCDPAAKFSERRPQVALGSEGGAPALRLFTPTGPDPAGRPAFFAPWGAQGQNGRGTNSFIQGTFVIFRQAWNGAHPHRPWVEHGSGAPSDARLRSTQSVNAARVGPDAGQGTAIQVKQQMMASFINTTCMHTIANPKHPCQLQYLLNTAVVRAGVSDWSRVAWFDKGNVMFDPAQGGIAVIDGPIKPSGTETVDGRSGLGLFTSQGSETQHGEFQGQVFDVRISFAQLQNALRIIAARQAEVPANAVTPGQLAELWGAAYADPGAWVLLSVNVAQETHNPIASREALIDGTVRDLFVGTQN